MDATLPSRPLEIAALRRIEALERACAPGNRLLRLKPEVLAHGKNTVPMGIKVGIGPSALCCERLCRAAERDLTALKSYSIHAVALVRDEPRAQIGERRFPCPEGVSRYGPVLETLCLQSYLPRATFVVRDVGPFTAVARPAVSVNVDPVQVTDIVSAGRDTLET